MGIKRAKCDSYHIRVRHIYLAGGVWPPVNVDQAQRATAKSASQARKFLKPVTRLAYSFSSANIRSPETEHAPRFREVPDQSVCKANKLSGMTIITYAKYFLIFLPHSISESAGIPT